MSYDFMETMEFFNSSGLLKLARSDMNFSSRSPVMDFVFHPKHVQNRGRSRKCQIVIS